MSGGLSNAYKHNIKGSMQSGMCVSAVNLWTNNVKWDKGPGFGGAEYNGRRKTGF